MNRNELLRAFNAHGPVVLPVIHVLDSEQTQRNTEIAIAGGCPGVFLINHDFEKEKLVPIIKEMRNAFPNAWIGVNFLAVTGKYAFPILGELEAKGVKVDGYWADDARMDERRDESDQPEADEIADIRKNSGWSGLYIGGTAFKKQRDVDPSRYGDAAREACQFMEVITTSGVATGQEADLGKIETFRAAIGDRPMALASGISPKNAIDYADVDCFMVATGINQQDNFYDIDPTKLAELMSITRTLSKGV